MINIFKTLKEYLDLIISLIIVISIYSLIRFAWSYYSLPDESQIIDLVNGFFTKYGLIVILLASIVESLLLIGNYFPGSLVIFLGVASSIGDVNRAIKTVALTIIGMLIGYSINYFLGKYGWYKVLIKFGLQEAFTSFKNKINKMDAENSLFKKVLVIGGFYIIPGSGSILSTSFGILNYNYGKFVSYAIFLVTFWNILWGILVYHFGMKIFEILSSYVAGIVLIIGVFAYLIYTGKYEELKNK